MINFFKYKKEILISFLILALYFITRFFRLMSLPIFTDEAIYVRWGQIALHDPTWRFISLTDGKQPMFVWIEMFFLKFIKDPLLAGRLVGVMSGFLTTIGMFFLGKEIFKNKWIGFLSSLIYVLYPFSLVYDRMAMYDSLVGAFTIWSLYLEILLVRYVRLDLSLMLGMVLGGGALTKSDAYFSMILMPFTSILFNFSKNKKIKLFLKWILFVLISLGLAFLYYNILRLSQFFGIIGEKNNVFIYSFSDWIKSPFLVFSGNLSGLMNWFVAYFKISLIILVLVSFLFKDNLKEKFLLLIWFLFPFIALAFFGKVLYPRLILFMTLSLIPLMAFSLYKLFLLKKGILPGIFIFLIFFSISIYTDYFVLFNFSHAPIADSDLNQYVNNWSAGGGINRMIRFFKNTSKNQKIYVGTEGQFGGILTLAMQIYLGNDKQIIADGYWPISDIIPAKILKYAKTMPTYFVFEQTQSPPIAWPLKFVTRYRKGISDNYMSIYKVVN